MSRRLTTTLCTFVMLLFVLRGRANEPAAAIHVKSSAPPAGLLWQDRGNIAALNLFYGPGGKEDQPTGKFKFVGEDMKGTSPKFDVEDDQGVKWRVKLGPEVKSETAATRLVWAIGFFADEDYYLPELHVDGLTKLRRGGKFITGDGTVRDVRLERKLKGQKKAGTWGWFDNPFAGTRQMNALKVMMALINNWDLKEINNSIYEEKSGEPRYVVTDLGASFGKTGNSLTRSKGNLHDYERTHFVQSVTPQYVNFHMNSRPFVLSVFNFPNYYTRTHMQAVTKKIPLADAKWLGQLLRQLTPEQIHDCFRAAGYSPAEVEGYSKVVTARIGELNRL